jgi:copper(I)-binding protein
MKLLIVALSLVFVQPAPTSSDATALVNGTMAAVFATVTNPTMYDLYIVSAKSDVAEKFEFLQGEKVVTSFTVPAFGSLSLQSPDGRVRMFGLKVQPKVGEELKLTLETDGGVGIPIAAIVKAVNP